MGAGTSKVKAEDLRPGHMVVIPGTGAFLVKGFRKVGGEVLAFLQWDSLALVLRKGEYREVLNPVKK